MDVDEQALHDLLLANKPEGAEHDAKACAFCTAAASLKEEGKVTDQAIFTQEQHDALLASAVEKAKEEAVASADAEILTLNEQLEAAKGELEKTSTHVAELEADIAARDEAAELEKLAGERVAAVKAVANFTDEQIDERKASWAKMSEEAFASYLEDIQVVAKAATEQKDEEDGPPKTSFDGTRATAGEEGTEGSAIEQFFSHGLSVAGV